MMDRGYFPKHVEFHLQNKFEKLVHLVGFIIKEIYHDARSHERKKPLIVFHSFWQSTYTLGTEDAYCVLRLFVKGKVTPLQARCGPESG
jgi:hypothetical protein